MKFSDIIRNLRGIFERKRKNPIQLERDSNLESNLKFLKVDTKNTPIQISEDIINIQGSLTVNGDAVQTGTDAGATALNELSDVTYSGNALSIDSLQDISMPTDSKISWNSGNDYMYASTTELFIAMDDSDVITITDNEVKSENPVFIGESANANTDIAGMGQLWIKNSTPNELGFTDDAGTDIVGIGKYQYDCQFVGYYGGTTAYLPINGYIIEKTSTSGNNEHIGFIAPFNGTIEKVAFRSEIAQSGDISFRVFESADGTEVPGTQIFRNETTVSLADDTYQELDLTGAGVGSDYSPLTKGRIYALLIITPANSFDTNVTVVFKWDITS